MAHTHTVLLYHIIFSTKQRERTLTPDRRDLIFPYMAGIIGNHGGTPMIINGVEDHVHILCRLRSTPDVAEVVQAIKGGSSAWFNKESGMGRIQWQEGYGAFSVSYSQRERVRRYIEDQEKHHASRGYAEEYEGFLIKHGAEYDPRFFLD